MFRNVASQVICAQLVNATDGSAVTTGTTTVYVTKDGGTQATGTGTVTHEGQGTWSYVPTAGETDAVHVAFTFANSSAISACVQTYTQDQFAAEALTRSARTLAYGTVGTGSTGTSVVVSAISLAGGVTSVGTNALAGRRVYFTGDTTTTGNRAAGARITANTSGSTPTLTLDVADTLPASPVSGDLFSIA